MECPNWLPLGGQLFVAALANAFFRKVGDGKEGGAYVDTDKCAWKTIEND